MKRFRILKTITIFMISGILLTACNTDSVSTEVEQNQNISKTYLADRDNSSTEIEEDLTESDLNDTDYEEESTELGWEYQDLGIKINADKKSGTCGENLKWTFEDGVLTISGTGDMVDWDSQPIWTLCYDYEEDSFLKEVIIKEGVTSIGKRAFGWEYNLERIQIPSSVKRIGDSAFTDCEALKSIEIPEQVTKLEDSFDGCKSLKTITIPKNIKIIKGSIPFHLCLDLEEICVDKANAVYTSEDGVLFNKEKTKLIRYPAGKKDISYTIPSGVTEIEEYAFRNNLYLKEVSFPESLVSIHDCAFEYTGLTSVHLPDTIQNVGSNAFLGCENLREVILSRGIKKVEDGTFYRCQKLRTITIPSNIEKIEADAFCECTKLEEIQVDKSNSNYVSEEGILFTKDKTKLVVYPVGKSNDAYTVPFGVKEIADYAFSNSKYLKKVSWSDSLLIIGDYAFENSGLISVDLPESVADVGKGAFFGCDNLEKAVLSKGMKEIKADTFSGCYGLWDVYIPDTIEKIDKSAFPDDVNIYTITQGNKHI